MKNRIPILPALILILCLTFSQVATGRVEVSAQAVEQKLHSFHIQIHIQGDSDFTTANGVVSGSGTQSDPYIIEGWEIDAQGGSYCIWVENTTAHFVIRNCTARNTTGGPTPPYYSGILLTNLTNGVVEGNNLTQNYIAIGIGNSNNVTIKNNEISSNNYPLVLGNATQCRIYGNTIKNNVYGVYIRESANITVEENLVTANGAWGILLYSTCDTEVLNNNVSSSLFHGIILVSSNNNTIFYNTLISNGGYGINITEKSTGNQIYYNNFFQNHGASKGVNGKCQAYDDSGNNSWCFAFGSIRGGNYWSNWDGQGWGSADAYPIDGGAGASDWYPLSSPVGESGFLAEPQIFPVLFLLASFAIIFRRKK
ncbi:MAG: right-handed parallel beta-helix repeat-containing protein [Thermoplasmata archaeon]